jgi:hypothetical protein
MMVMAVAGVAKLGTISAVIDGRLDRTGGSIHAHRKAVPALVAVAAIPAMFVIVILKVDASGVPTHAIAKLVMTTIRHGIFLIAIMVGK